MSVRMVVAVAVLSAVWLFGLVGQFDSAEAGMRYLALSMAILAFGAWRWQPRPAVLRRWRDRRRPPQ